MESKGAPAFSIADLQGGSKRLSAVPESKSGGSKASDIELDPVLVEKYKELYQKHDGDLDLM
jgi:hypothetical protein